MLEGERVAVIPSRNDPRSKDFRTISLQGGRITLPVSMIVFAKIDTVSRGSNYVEVIFTIGRTGVITFAPLRHVFVISGTHDRSPAGFAGAMSTIIGRTTHFSVMA